MFGFLEMIGLILNNIFSEIIVYLILPVLLILWQFKTKNTCILFFIIKTTNIALFIITLFWVPLREMSVGYYSNYLILGLFIISTIISFGKARKLPFSKNKLSVGILSNIPGILVFMVLISFNIIAFLGFFYPEKPINLGFPLKNGNYLVTQGGNGVSSYLMNYHFNAWKLGIPGDTREKYSTDIVKINLLGFSYNSFNLFFSPDLPKDLNKYEIFDEILYSPCDGEIYDANDNCPDLPPSRKISSEIGNQVLIKYDETTFISLYHLKEGSITVESGSTVKKGQPLAKIGNSGQTTMPHLHIQAYKIDGPDYKGIPILFDGSFPVKNKVYRR